MPTHTYLLLSVPSDAGLPTSHFCTKALWVCSHFYLVCTVCDCISQTPSFGCGSFIRCQWWILQMTGSVYCRKSHCEKAKLCMPEILQHLNMQLKKKSRFLIWFWKEGQISLCLFKNIIMKVDFLWNTSNRCFILLSLWDVIVELDLFSITGLLHSDHLAIHFLGQLGTGSFQVAALAAIQLKISTFLAMALGSTTSLWFLDSSFGDKIPRCVVCSAPSRGREELASLAGGLETEGIEQTDKQMLLSADFPGFLRVKEDLGFPGFLCKVVQKPSHWQVWIKQLSWDSQYISCNRVWLIPAIICDQVTPGSSYARDTAVWDV